MEDWGRIMMDGLVVFGTCTEILEGMEGCWNRNSWVLLARVVDDLKGFWKCGLKRVKNGVGVRDVEVSESLLVL